MGTTRSMFAMVGFAGALVAGLALTGASAQTAPGLANQGRDCQTVRTCNFSRSGAVRGCLSSYTCRTCRLVASRCQIGALRGPCQKMSCSWGG